MTQKTPTSKLNLTPLPKRGRGGNQSEFFIKIFQKIHIRMISPFYLDTYFKQAPY